MLGSAYKLIISARNMTSKSILALLYILNTLRELKVNVDDVLTEHGINQARLAADSLIDRALELRLLNSLAQQLPRADAGLKVGQGFGFTGYGPFIFLLLSSDNAYQALQCALRYQQLSFLFGQINFIPGKTESAIWIDPVELPDPTKRFLIDIELSGTYQLLRDLQNRADLEMLPIRVDFPYPEPADISAYQAIFNCPVHFNCAKPLLWFNNPQLQNTLSTADPTAHTYYRTLCEQSLQLNTGSSEQLPQRVRQHLQLFEHGYPNASQVAAAMGMPERSLRHRLKSAGSSYRHLLEEARFSHARTLLSETEQSVENVAQALGYAEAAAFIRAFQRWAGCTPASYRRRLTAD